VIEVKCGWDNGGGFSGQEHLVWNGPTLFVDIGFDPAYKPGPGVTPVAGQKKLPALVDTGAGESCIDSTLAMHLKLPIVDRRVVAGAHGAKEVNMHLAQIHIPSLNFTIHGSFAAVDLIAGGQTHHALIGRTFLQNFEMIYEGTTGTVRLISK